MNNKRWAAKVRSWRVMVNAWTAMSGRMHPQPMIQTTDEAAVWAVCVFLRWGAV